MSPEKILLKISLLAAVTRRLRAFKRDESGATAVEYGIFLTTLSFAYIFALQITGNEVVDTFTFVSDAFTAIMPSAPAAPTTP